jgi:2-polyprenyl-6-methoxyphenol hydroxylase-like FAD-dependent oxidoreductase
MAKTGEHAVVLGASVAGMLAARVLADYFDTVTVVERDILGDGPDNRRGVPQDRHLHGLLMRGAQVLEELFPASSTNSYPQARRTSTATTCPRCTSA